MVKEAATAPEQSYATGFWPENGAVAAVTGRFLIQACDAHGNKRSSGDDKFSVEIRGVASDAVHLTDRGNGTYTVDYCVPIEGTYTLTCTLQGHHIRGSPSTLTVYRCAAACHLISSPLHVTA